MYRNLNAAALGISARQSELVETALTHGFRGIDVEIADVLKRAQSLGVDVAAQILLSANVRIGGFDLPVRWQEDEKAFEEDLKELDKTAEIAKTIAAETCHTIVSPASDSLPYHENFEMHRQRLTKIAEVLGRHDIRLAVGFHAAAARREGGRYEFIHDTDAFLKLVKLIAGDNIGLLLDAWDWHVGGGTLDQLRQLDAGKIASVRLANAPADADLATITEERRLMPDEEGSIDSAAIIQYLVEQDYGGPVSIFASPESLEESTREALVARANECFDTIWQNAGIGKTGRLEGVVSEKT